QQPVELARLSARRVGAAGHLFCGPRPDALDGVELTHAPRWETRVSCWPPIGAGKQTLERQHKRGLPRALVLKPCARDNRRVATRCSGSTRPLCMWFYFALRRLTDHLTEPRLARPRPG